MRNILRFLIISLNNLNNLTHKLHKLQVQFNKLFSIRILFVTDDIA